MYYFTFRVNFCVMDPGNHLCGNRQLMSSIAGMQMGKQNKKWSFSSPVEGLLLLFCTSLDTSCCRSVYLMWMLSSREWSNCCSVSVTFVEMLFSLATSGGWTVVLEHPAIGCFKLYSFCLYYTKSSFLLCYCEHFLYNCMLVFCRKWFCFLHGCSLQKLYN